MFRLGLRSLREGSLLQSPARAENNGPGPGNANRRCLRVEVEVEATGGVRVQPGDTVRRGQALGAAPDFRGPLCSPVDGVVEAVGFNPATHRFEISIKVSSPAPH